MTNHTSVSKFLRSADGTQIYADALGDPSKPAVVLIHGFGQSAVSFDTIFEDVEYLEHVYLVRVVESGLFCPLSIEFRRYAMTLEAMVVAINLRAKIIGNPSV